MILLSLLFYSLSGNICNKHSRETKEMKGIIAAVDVRDTSVLYYNALCDTRMYFLHGYVRAFYAALLS